MFPTHKSFASTSTGCPQCFDCFRGSRSSSTAGFPRRNRRGSMYHPLPPPRLCRAREERSLSARSCRNRKFRLATGGASFRFDALARVGRLPPRVAERERVRPSAISVFLSSRGPYPPARIRHNLTFEIKQTLLPLIPRLMGLPRCFIRNTYYFARSDSSTWKFCLFKFAFM